MFFCKWIRKINIFHQVPLSLVGNFNPKHPTGQNSPFLRTKRPWSQNQHRIPSVPEIFHLRALNLENRCSFAKQSCEVSLDLNQKPCRVLSFVCDDNFRAVIFDIFVSFKMLIDCLGQFKSYSIPEPEVFRAFLVRTSDFVPSDLKLRNLQVWMLIGSLLPRYSAGWEILMLKSRM